MSIATDRSTVKKGETWQNRKLGTNYEILAIGICCDNDKNNQLSIIYTSDGELYTRCEDEFLQKFLKVG